MANFLCIPCIESSDAVISKENESKFVECEECSWADHCFPVEGGKLLKSSVNKVVSKLESDFKAIFS